jgi:hypothetical protein
MQRFLQEDPGVLALPRQLACVGNDAPELPKRNFYLTDSQFVVGPQIHIR